jgi:trehalose/maltose hydrolase-like predicted phosphorylase
MTELDLVPQEVEAWERAAQAMFVPYDERRGIHPQDANFLEREAWDLEATVRGERHLLTVGVPVRLAGRLAEPLAPPAPSPVVAPSA